MFETANGWLKTFTDIGVSVILACVVIDILFPSSNLVLAGLGKTVAEFSDKGLSGFIALLLFVVFWQKRGSAATS
jgi:hypothetical protein